MKLRLLVFLQLIAFSVFASNQSSVEGVSTNKEAVEIVNTGSRAVYLIDNFFTKSITKEILKQISAEELATVKANCNESSYPECLQTLLGFSMDEGATEKAEGIIKSLKIYRIAKFDNIRNGENFGEQSILWVPAAENPVVDGNCSIDHDFYIIIYSRDIQVLD